MESKTVSTHSRPRAAGGCAYALFLGLLCFNTQPPEGGWSRFENFGRINVSFNTQPPEGGWADILVKGLVMKMFQHTAARGRLDSMAVPVMRWIGVSTHSRPRAAGLSTIRLGCPLRFQHTAARGRLAGQHRDNGIRTFGFNTQPPEGGWMPVWSVGLQVEKFQHTAARGRLGPIKNHILTMLVVSTHSRPRAAVC